MPTLPSTTSAAHADRAIAHLASELGYATGDVAGETYDRMSRYSPGPRGSAEVCLEDAQACRERGDWHHALIRAERGLAHLRIVL